MEGTLKFFRDQIAGPGMKKTIQMLPLKKSVVLSDSASFFAFILWVMTQKCVWNDPFHCVI